MTTDTLNDLLERKEETHGRYSDNADLTIRMYSVVSSPEFAPEVNFGLFMICGKFARILSGGMQYEHVIDIAGYAQCIFNHLTEVKNIRHALRLTPEDDPVSVTGQAVNVTTTYNLLKNIIVTAPCNQSIGGDKDAIQQLLKGLTICVTNHLHLDNWKKFIADTQQIADGLYVEGLKDVPF